MSGNVKNSILHVSLTNAIIYVIASVKYVYILFALFEKFDFSSKVIISLFKATVNVVTDSLAV